MKLEEALAQIVEIRDHIQRDRVFRGYRSAPVAGSALIAAMAAGLQPAWVAHPAEHPARYVALWSTAAALSLAFTAIGMVRFGTLSRAAGRRHTWDAIEPLVPSLAAGALVTFVLLQSSPGLVELLPGLWQVLFSLGLFASRRSLPRPAWAVAAFYLAAGLIGLQRAAGPDPLNPWAMGLPFAVGQLASAALLFWTLERDDGRHA